MTKGAKNTTRSAKSATQSADNVTFGALPEADSSKFITSPQADKIFEALAKAQGSVEKAARTKQAEDEQRRESWTYAGLDDVMDAIRTARADNGLAVVERFPTGKKALHVLLVHSSGQWIDYGTYSLGDYKTHNEKTAAVTVARRVMLKCIFNVVDKGDDTDARGEGNSALTAEAITGEPLEDDAGPRELTDKEKRQGYQDAKNEWLVECPITPDGRKDFDAFAAGYEKALESVKTMNDLSMLSKANNKNLNELQEERPDLFDHLTTVASPITQKLM